MCYLTKDPYIVRVRKAWKRKLLTTRAAAELETKSPVCGRQASAVTLMRDLDISKTDLNMQAKTKGWIKCTRVALLLKAHFHNQVEPIPICIIHKHWRHSLLGPHLPSSRGISKLPLAHTKYLYNELLNFLDDVFLLPGHWIKELSYSWTNTNTSSSTCNCFLTYRLVNTRWEYNTRHSTVKVPTIFPLVNWHEALSETNTMQWTHAASIKMLLLGFVRGALAVLELASEDQAGLSLPPKSRDQRHAPPLPRSKSLPS